MSASNKPSIVFAHGIWADGSCASTKARPNRHPAPAVILLQKFFLPLKIGARRQVSGARWSLKPPAASP
jgi:hypothetical protein